MNLYQQLMHEREACLEPLPSGLSLREIPDAFKISGFSATEAGDLEALFSGASECIQLTAGRFKGDVRSLEIGAVTLIEFTVNCGILLRAQLDDSRLLVGIPDPAEGVRVIENGRPCPAGGLIFVSRRDLKLSVLGAASVTWLAVDLTRLPRSLKNGIGALIGTDASGYAETAPSQAAALRDFVRWHLHLTKGERRAFARIGKPERVDATAAGLLIAVMQRTNLVAQSHAARARSDLVQSTEGFMWDNIEGPLCLEQICARGGCKVRTLIYAFKAQFGLSPMKYFKIRRLNAARRKLRSAAGKVRIFDIAADCGFWHMGHFGKDFKAMFGVSPESTTRRRRLGPQA